MSKTLLLGAKILEQLIRHHKDEGYGDMAKKLLCSTFNL